MMRILKTILKKRMKKNRIRKSTTMADIGKLIAREEEGEAEVVVEEAGQRMVEEAMMVAIRGKRLIIFGLLIMIIE